MGVFRFRQFSVINERSALKLGTDAVLLGSAMTLPLPSDDTFAVKSSTSGNTLTPAFLPGPQCLDIGTGTGVIALMLAQRCPRARILGIDIDLPSFEEAADNFARSPWPDRLTAAHLSLEQLDTRLDVSLARAATAEGEGCPQFDLIFSNPPYYDTSLLNPDSREAEARHSCSLSYRDILRFAARRLSPHGTLSLILPAQSESELLRFAASCGLNLFRIVRIRTTPKKPFRRIIAEFSLSPAAAQCPFEEQFSLPSGLCQSPVQEELTLQDGKCRSRQYEELTREFYL